MDAVSASDSTPSQWWVPPQQETGRDSALEQRNFHALVDLVFQHMTDALRAFFLRRWAPFALRHRIDDACRAETLVRPNSARLRILPHSFSKFQVGTFKSWKVKLFDISFMSTLCTARCDDEPLFSVDEAEGFTLCRDIRNSLAHQPDIYISSRLLDDFLGLSEKAMGLFPSNASEELDPVRLVIQEIRNGTYSPLSHDIPMDLFRVEEEFLEVDWDTPFRNADKSLLYLGEFNRRDVVVKFFQPGDDGLRALHAEVHRRSHVGRNSTFHHFPPSPPIS